MSERAPYIPTQHEWQECFEMLCEKCSRGMNCTIIEGMIECKDGSNWPDGGWVTDPGADVTCLSYKAPEHDRLPRPALNRYLKSACDMCDGCAARKGSEASTALHTQRDFKAAVNARLLFACHDPENKGKPCGGWADAVRKKRSATT